MPVQCFYCLTHFYSKEITQQQIDNSFTCPIDNCTFIHYLRMNHSMILQMPSAAFSVPRRKSKVNNNNKRKISKENKKI